MDRTQSQPKTEAEKLNEQTNPSGIAWRGTFSIFCKVNRTYASDPLIGRVMAGQEGWMPWTDCSQESPITFYEIVKKDGKWEFKWLRGSIYSVDSTLAVDCNRVPVEGR